MTRIPAGSFSYIGQRTYVHSTDLMADAERILADHHRHRIRLMRSYKIYREITRQGQWSLADREAAAAASFRLRDEQDGEVRLHYLDDGETVTRSRPDEASFVADLVTSGPFEGRATCSAPATVTGLFKALVDMNKALHVASLAADGAADRPYRFVYMEDLPWSGVGVGTPIRARSLGVRRRDDHDFSLAALSVGETPNPVKLCFSF